MAGAIVALLLPFGLCHPCECVVSMVFVVKMRDGSCHYCSFLAFALCHNCECVVLMVCVINIWNSERHCCPPVTLCPMSL